MFGIFSAKPAGDQRADRTHAADGRERRSAQHGVLTAQREIGGQVSGEENQIQAANEIGGRHHKERPVPHGLAEHLTHGSRFGGRHRNFICAAGHKRRGQHRETHDDEKHHRDLPFVVRQYKLAGERADQCAQ